MLRVFIEMDSAVTFKRSTLDTLEISLRGVGEGNVGSYDVKLLQSPVGTPAKFVHGIRKGSVRNFNRDRGALELVRKAIETVS
jgi:hypothetical protein